MSKFFVDDNQVKEEKIKIIGNDVNHIKNVLRKKQNDILTICNISNMKDYLCEISKIDENYIECEIKEEIQNCVESNVHVTIMQGLPKADKMEFIIQKSVELGVYNIIPVEMKRCVVKLNDKDKHKKIDRWQKISEVAAKQSGRNIIPHINNVTNIKNICNLIKEYDIVLVAYEKERKETIKEKLKKIKEVYNINEEIRIAIIIGPEGGIDQEEIELLEKNEATTITLGKRILRTETASLNILSIIMYELEM
jgi:16S rRNA (uracil1498-N3)-methyltransferase